MKIINDSNRVTINRLTYGDTCMVEGDARLFLYVQTTQKEVRIQPQDWVRENIGNCHKLISLSDGEVKCMPIGSRVKKVKAEVHILD